LSTTSSNLRKTIDWKNQFNNPLVSAAVKNAYDEETGDTTSKQLDSVSILERIHAKIEARKTP